MSIPDYKIRDIIGSLPVKTVKRWEDGDARCHCTHCDWCGILFATDVYSKHVEECKAALVAALERARVVAALDAWAHEHHAFRAAFRTDKVDEYYLCHSPSVTTAAWGRGPTPDAARSAAAAAIEKGEVG